jgi:regulator of replication initiation timing
MQPSRSYRLTFCRQRAFRERKEQHLHDLNDQLASLKTQVSVLQAENKALRVPDRVASPRLRKNDVNDISSAAEDESLPKKYYSGSEIVEELGRLATNPCGNPAKAVSQLIQPLHRAENNMGPQGDCIIPLESLWTLINIIPVHTAGQVNLVHLIPLLELIATFRQPARVDPRVSAHDTVVLDTRSK